MLKIMRRLSPWMMIPAMFFAFVQVGCVLLLPYITADIVTNGVSQGNTAYALQQGIQMAVVAVVCFGGTLLNMYFFSKISYKLGADLREDIFRKTLSFSKHEFDKIGTSSLITRTTNDVTQVQNLVELGCKNLIFSIVVLVGGIVMTWLLSPKLALVYLSVTPLLLISYFVIYRFANPLYVKIQKSLDSLNLYFREGLTGARVIRAFTHEERVYEKYKAENRNYTHTSVTAETIMSVFTPLISLLICLATVVIVWVAGKGISDSTIAVGSIIGAVSYALHILRGFGMLTSVILAIPRGQVSAKRINEVIDMPLSINDPETLMAGECYSPLRFDHVDFRYPGASRQTLTDISFEVQNGQTLAIIGSTGSGKSSLVSLLSRLYDAEKGGILIGGTDIRNLPQSVLHDMVSFSHQKTTLFLGTIRSNMLLGKPDASDDEMWEALDIANATEFVKALDKGLDSAVAKTGGNFSGGQKQRLCIARTILKNTGIYVFDDSFSSLDLKTDAAVRSAMRGKLKDAITIIVAQRISTVMNADMIAVLDAGKLVGLGDHETLKESCPVYRQIIDSQFHKEDAAA